MKKFFTLIIAALLLVTTSAYAETQEIDYSAIKAKTLKYSIAIEEFYSSLPQAKGKYKNRLRPILIEGALNIETNVLVKALKNPVTYRDSKYLFIAGTYKNYPVVVVRTEQGLANAATSTALAIKMFNPVAVINQGTAGGTIPEAHVGNIVIGEKSFPASAFRAAYSAKGAGVDYTAQEMRGTYVYDETTNFFKPQGEYLADKNLLEVSKKVADANSYFNVVTGAIGSADWWMSWLDYVSFLNEKYGMAAEEMETVAAAQICHNMKIPFIGIRVISDNDSNDNEGYNPDVADRSQRFVLLVVDAYIRDVLKK
ncbi:MAG: 5'-methylthioadenosine/S-adenosylhomocysteine nucleosidase [Selenomonadaceae bacterium]|nr:5'-methylthioadenosine/S-adenosylhomocysteine nucleosidase [Selenomonadaceae bacterium]